MRRIAAGAPSAGPALTAVFLFVLATASAMLAQAAPVKIVALGASNTAGFGVASSESYPAQLEALVVAQGIAARVVNAGIAGDTTGGMLRRLDTDVPDDTGIVILQPGTNDARYGTGAERQANIANIAGQLAARGIKLIVIENSMLAELPDTEMQSDGIHYTPKGYAMLAQRLLPQVRAALGK